MPNFTCEQRTSRYFGDQGADVITAIVTYEDGKESYKEIKSNGKPVIDDKLLHSGTWSTGQFTSDIRGLFDTSNKVTFQYVNESNIDSRRVLTFQYRVAYQNVALWQLRLQDQAVAPPYHGQLWIDEDTGILLRLQLVATEIPRSFPMRSADLQIDYEDVPFGDGTSFVLPLKAVVNNADLDGRKQHNVLQFRNCRKFRATSRIVPD